MASIVVNNLPCNVVRPIKGVDWAEYVGVRPCVNLKTVCVRLANRVSNRLHSIVRATRDGPMKKFRLRDEDCELFVVDGTKPNAPLVLPKPGVPVGTPQLIHYIPINRRPRRNRKSPALRAAFQETSLTPAKFVYALFIHEGEENTPIGDMPGCYKLGWRSGLIEEVSKARDVGVNSVLLSPKLTDALKSSTGDEVYNENGLVPRAIRLLKDKFPDLVIFADVVLDSSNGHDGVGRENGVKLDDETVHRLCKKALVQARAGADVISSRDAVGGSVEEIRYALDDECFHHVSIMSYTTRYASTFSGPCSEALESKSRFGDKKNYQMNQAIFREVQGNLLNDDAIGVDIHLVKPGLPYLDIIRFLRDRSILPIAAYQGFGEYSMIKAGGLMKMIDEEHVMMESLMCLRRAGADIIITHFALQAARCLCGEKR